MMLGVSTEYNSYATGDGERNPFVDKVNIEFCVMQICLAYEANSLTKLSQWLYMIRCTSPFVTNYSKQGIHIMRAVGGILRWTKSLKKGLKKI